MVSAYIGLLFPLPFTTSMVIGVDDGWTTTGENDDVVGRVVVVGGGGVVSERWNC